EHGATSRQVVDGADHVVAAGVLEQEPVGPGLERRADVTVGVVGGQHQDPGAGAVVFAQGQDRLGSPTAGHAQVHQHHVGVGVGDNGQCLPTVCGDADDLDLGVGAEHRHQAVAHDRMIVDHHGP